MSSLTIKGISEELLDTLRNRAAQHRRSLNSEVLSLLERSVGPSAVDPESFLARLGQLQSRAPLPPLTDAFLEEAIGEGRP
jgi:plasmid stability protein